MTKEFTLIEISDDKPMIEWGSKLMSEFNEDAIESIKRENITEETVFLIDLDGKKYMAFFTEGENIQPSDQTMEVNQKHRAILKEIRIRRIDGSLLYSLKTPKHD